MAAQYDERQTMKRRGILAAAGAVVAGIVAKQAAQPVVADGALSAPGANTASGVTTLLYTGTDLTNANIFSVSSSTDFSSTHPAAVAGYAETGAVHTGVFGFSNQDTGAGVYGKSASLSPAVVAENTGAGYGVSVTSAALGVRSDSTGDYGVYGNSQTTDGIFGATFAAVGSGKAGVYGVGNGTGTLGVRGDGNVTGIGVQGQNAQYGVVGMVANRSNTIGVWGNNQSTGANSHGVVGQSATGYGVLGYSTGGSASLSGISTNVNIPAFAGGNSVAGGLAASYAGTVFVNGMFVVADMTQKHGLLKHPDGSHRLMYTVEAPESWAEDFGTGTLAGGKAEIKLDPDFAALVHTEDYHVFLTAHGDYHVHVAERTAGGFVAQVTSGAGAAVKGVAGVSGTFSYRVVAKPKSDKKVERLGKFAVPNVPLPDVSQLPKAPVTPPVLKKP